MIKNMFKLFASTILIGSLCYNVYGQSTYLPLPSNNNLYIIKNGMETKIENMSAYNINGKNYFKLRDMGIIMEFYVEYDSRTNEINVDTSKNSSDKMSHIENISKNAVKSSQSIFIDAKRFGNLEAYNIDGNNYFSIRDFSDIIGYDCIWNGNENKITINLDSDNDSNTNSSNVFIEINEKLNINPKEGDVQALTDYLAKNAQGFNENCKLEDIESEGSNGDYRVIYSLYYKGFRTQNDLMVFIGNDGIKYVNKIVDFNINGKDITINGNDVSEGEIENAKKKALEGFGNYKVYSQSAEKQLDLNLRPMIYVVTVFEDKTGSKFTTNYTYYLD